MMCLKVNTGGGCNSKEELLVLFCAYENLRTNNIFCENGCSIRLHCKADGSNMSQVVSCLVDSVACRDIAMQ
jgi:hypothetical protein